MTQIIIDKLPVLEFCAFLINKIALNGIELKDHVSTTHHGHHFYMMCFVRTARSRSHGMRTPHNDMLKPQKYSIDPSCMQESFKFHGLLCFVYECAFLAKLRTSGRRKTKWGRKKKKQKIPTEYRKSPNNICSIVGQNLFAAFQRK